MTIKFVLDNAQRREEALVNEILETIKQKPKLEESTKKLATFMDVVFRTAMRGRQMREAVKEIVHPEKHETRKGPKIFNPAAAELENKEYLLKIFDTPVGILIDKGEHDSYSYEVMEPKPEPAIIDKAKALIKADFQRRHSVLDDNTYIRGQVANACRQLKQKCDSDVARRTAYYLKRDLLGFRRIDPLMHDQNVKAIHCEGINKPVKIEYKGIPGKIGTSITFTDPKDLQALINRIASYAGAKVTSSSPVLDVTLGGFRIHATAGVSGVSAKLLIKRLDS